MGLFGGNTGKVTIHITAKDAASRVIDGTQRRIKSFGSALLSIKGLAAGIALGAFAQLARSIFRLGSAAEETESKFSVTFGAMTEKVNAFAESFDILNKVQAKDFLATTGAILKGMGYAEEAAADASIAVGRLARDFASFNNRNIEDTFLAVNAAITGEREQLKRLGVVIREEEVQQRALIETGKKRVDQLTQQEKAQATLTLITKRAGVQLGDYDRTAGSSANTNRRVASSIQDIAQSISQKLLPAYNSILTWMDQSLPRIERWADRVAGLIASVFDPTGLRARGEIAAAMGDEALPDVFARRAGLVAERRRLEAELSTLPRGRFERAAGAFGNMSLADRLRAGVHPAMAAATAADLLQRPQDRQREIANRIAEIDRVIAATRDRASSLKGTASGAVEDEPMTAAEKEAKKKEVETLDFEKRRLEREIALARSRRLGGGPGGFVRTSRTPFGDLDLVAGGGAKLPGIERGEGGFTENLMEDLREATEGVREFDEVLAELAAGSIMDVGSAYEDMVSAIVSGQGDLMKKGAAAALGFVRQVASALGDEQIAKGVADLAEGTWPPNPVAWAAAGKHFAAAALFKTLAGVSGGLGARAGGGSGGGGGSFGRTAGVEGAANRGGGTIVIQGGLLDLSNPDQERQFSDAVEQIADRRITVRAG
jgi:hypothetical protein